MKILIFLVFASSLLSSCIVVPEYEYRGHYYEHHRHGYYDGYRRGWDGHRDWGDHGYRR